MGRCHTTMPPKPIPAKRWVPHDVRPVRSLSVCRWDGRVGAALMTNASDLVERTERHIREAAEYLAHLEGFLYDIEHDVDCPWCHHQ